MNYHLFASPIIIVFRHLGSMPYWPNLAISEPSMCPLGTRRKLIRNDFRHYYDYVKKEKEDQIHAMIMLRKYIDQLIVDGKLTDEDLENSRGEQEKILNEIDVIKEGLDKITENDTPFRTDDIINYEIERDLDMDFEEETI